MSSVLKWIYLVIGSVTGGFTRYLFGGFIHRYWGSDFPYGTLCINLSGCFLIGLFDALATEKFLLTPDLKVLLMIGFCGAFTTFSTLILETSNLVRTGEWGFAMLNLCASVIVGFLFLRLGMLIGKVI